MSYLNFAVLLEDHTKSAADTLRQIGDNLEAEQLAKNSRWRNFTMHLGGTAVCLGLLLLGTTIVKQKI